jgi:hypothetical protein
MRDESLSFFKPIAGKIISVEGKKVTVNAGAKDSVRTGMRLNILREEAPFRHPVTKEPLGILESLTGRIEIKEVRTDSSIAEIIGGDAKEGDRVRISEIRVNMLFCQSKDTDWQLSDSYYRTLRETERFNLIDTSIETDTASKAVEEARRLGADVALLLTSKTTDSGTVLVQRLFWVSDGSPFSEVQAEIDTAAVREMRVGEEFFPLPRGEAMIRLDLPVGAKLISSGDVNGDGKQEIILCTGKDIRFYTLSADLQPAFGGSKIKGSNSEDCLWLDSIDLNRNGKDEVIITTIAASEGSGDPTLPATTKGDTRITSYIYELQGAEFVLVYKDGVFMRRLENNLIAQAYSRGEGFEGEVFGMRWDGEYKKGDPIGVPASVDIYDFVSFDDLRMGRLIAAYDGEGFLNVYNDKDMKIWRSRSGTGGFLNTFKKSAPTTMLDRGEWSVKDRLFLRNKDILVVKRTPLLEMVKSLGYSKSRIDKLWWNGFSMEEGGFIEDISGTITDYTLAGDKLIVLVSPMLGIKPGNILKGENPVRTELHIYSIKGR